MIKFSADKEFVKKALYALNDCSVMKPHFGKTYDVCPFCNRWTPDEEPIAHRKNCILPDLIKFFERGEEEPETVSFQVDQVLKDKLAFELEGCYIFESYEMSCPFCLSTQLTGSPNFIHEHDCKREMLISVIKNSPANMITFNADLLDVFINALHESKLFYGNTEDPDCCYCPMCRVVEVNGRINHKNCTIGKLLDIFTAPRPIDLETEE